VERRGRPRGTKETGDVAVAVNEESGEESTGEEGGRGEGQRGGHKGGSGTSGRERSDERGERERRATSGLLQF